MKSVCTPNLLLGGLLIASVCGCCVIPPARVTLHPAPAMVRIGGADGTPVPAPARSYKMEMVRNEREGFQFAVVPARGQNIGVHVGIEAITSGAPPVELYRVLAVNHTAPPATGEFVLPPRRLGWIPDVLIPQPNPSGPVTPAGNAGDMVPLTYYVEFKTDPQTPPGRYRYVVGVVEGRGIRTLGVEVRVHKPILPTRLPFRTATTWNWTLEDYYGRPLTLQDKQVFWNFCLDHRLSPCTFFAKAPDPTPADLSPLTERGLSVINVLFVGGKNPRPLSTEFKQKIAPQLRQWREQLKAIGMERDAVILAADEPEPSAIATCRQNVKWLKEQFPEAKIWIATRPSPEWAEFTDLFDPVMAFSTDFYKPHSHTDEALRFWRQTRPLPAGEYWWFHSVEPYAPYTNVRLDNLPIEGRIAGWQSALYGVDGYEYVWITDWKANKDTRDMPWPQRAAAWKTGWSGAGTLCYPDEHMRPMPSLRLVNLRDGFEDWALIEMLTHRTDRKARAELIDPVTHSLAEWTTDPQVVLEARHKVITALQAGPAATHKAF